MNPLVNFDLQALNTLSVPSRAEYFYKASTIDEVLQVVSWASKNSKSINVLGGGSNVLLPEFIYGFTLMPALKGIRVIDQNDESIWVEAQAGEPWPEFVDFCLSKSYFGLENLSLIPGTVGAAPIQNIGAYGLEVEECLEYVCALDLISKKIVKIEASKCNFSYRDSLFKSNSGQFIVLSVVFRLRKKPQLIVEYPALKNYIEANGFELSPMAVAKAVKELRLSKLPDPNEIPNVGSFFKNPVVSGQALQQLKSQSPDIIAYELNSMEFKVAAGWLIEKAGWKGRTQQGVCVHEKQALVLTNPKRQALAKVLDLAEAIRSSIHQKFGIRLEIEPQILGNAP